MSKVDTNSTRNRGIIKSTYHFLYIYLQVKMWEDTSEILGGDVADGCTKNFRSKKKFSIMISQSQAECFYKSTTSTGTCNGASSF